MAKARQTTLSKFLSSTRSEYLDALKAGKGSGWTVAIGNEAGDLDSAASSIAYSYLASKLLGQPTVALLRTPRTDLHLRAENLHAFEFAHLNKDQSDLFCIDDIPTDLLQHISSSSFALVDHNRLHTQFYDKEGKVPNIVAIIDHHEDEGQHTDTATRVVKVPVGSCASLVARHFQEPWEKSPEQPPSELASLLLSAIFIDTSGLRYGGKAEKIDREAAEFLFPRSTFAAFATSETKLQDSVEALSVIATLEERKLSVSHLSSRDLLRRDYKEYTFHSKLDNYGQITVGIATVPLNIKTWMENDPSPTFWASMDQWMEERALDVLGVLCTYRSPRNGSHKRQTIWVVKGGKLSLKDTLWNGLEANVELKLKPREMDKKSLSRGIERDENGDVKTPAGSIARAWKQGNAKATRKAMAPLIKSLIEG
ncbi:hypothetical protein M422DRAFT_260436 [Sphaerobolus stellatus SS14]|uniref:DHHA2 domain-containing protein n=1 Tax=Sphaerobolus stellatus (strain SS14) TaxID=990650 RepID=A0A0C9U2K3_SPHS4|nr:hypothetical protein M422DRAFT_260436 [Sphaerobolus stellatus SS14]